jgi:hypothetical protein
VDIIKRWLKGEFKGKETDDLADIEDMDYDEEETDSLGNKRISQKNILRNSTTVSTSNGLDRTLSGMLAPQRQRGGGTRIVHGSIAPGLLKPELLSTKSGKTFFQTSEDRESFGKNALAFDDSFQLKDEEAIIEEYEIKDKPYWFHIGEKDAYVDVESMIHGEDYELNKLKNFTNQIVDSTDQQVLDGN